MYNKNTSINWITVRSEKESEWHSYKKAFYLDKKIARAFIRFESDCVCGIFVNGDFISASTGRTPERVSFYEITSKLLQGENVIEAVTGGHYFQGFALSTRSQRGYWMNQLALEATVEFFDGSKEAVVTDSTWTSDLPIIESAQVTKAEYETMWQNAYLWRETDSLDIPKEVIQVVGEEYKGYVNKSLERLIPYKSVVETDMAFSKGEFISHKDECSIIIDMGRTVVGFIEFDYSLKKDAVMEAVFDVTEQLKDFELEGDFAYFVERLKTCDKLSKEASSYRNLRRRAFRYAKFTFKNAKGLSITPPKVRLCISEISKGWFSCSDEMLNTVWEMGKYTLKLNKHQEYESCPRNEMLFFAGDGQIDALVDAYTFGNCDMLKTSLSLNHEESAAGIARLDKFDRTVWQWDYFAWRIICIYDYFRYTKDLDFLKAHYAQAVKNILWLTERMNGKNLLFQTPAFHSTSSCTLIQVDWACSTHRLGENAYINCMLYKGLICMAELASVMNDDRSDEWQKLADKVKEAINTHLWSDEKLAYVDRFTDYIAQDSNALAVLFGVADKKKAPSVLNSMKERLWSPYGSQMADKHLNGILRGGSTTVSPMMSTHEAEAHFMYGKAEDGLELVRRVWGAMLQKGATTCWEFDPNNSDERWEHSVCHAWSAGCTYLLSAFVAGIRIEAKNKITFSPRPCDINCGKCVVPTPYGLIAVSWENNEYKIALPLEIEIKTALLPESKLEIVGY